MVMYEARTIRAQPHWPGPDVCEGLTVFKKQHDLVDT